MPDLDPNTSTDSQNSARAYGNVLDRLPLPDRVRLAGYCSLVDRWRQDERPERRVQNLIVGILVAVDNALERDAA